MNRMFEMIIDCGDNNIVKLSRCGKSIADIKRRWSGNGDFVRVKDVTEQYPISEQKVMDALIKAQFGEAERETIVHLLRTGYANSIPY